MTVKQFHNILNNKINKTRNDNELIELLNSFDDDILHRCKIVTIKKNHTLLKMGDNIEYMYIIVHGQTRVVNVFENGKLYEPVLINDNEIIGTMEILQNYPTYISSIYTTYDTKLIRITKQDTLKLLNENLLFTKLILKCISKDFFNQSFHQGEKLIQNSMFLLVDYLLRQVETSRDKKITTITNTREVISNRTGINLRTLYRNIKRLRELELLDVIDRKIVIKENQSKQLYKYYDRLRGK
ncbi:DNA-binding transcriptional activator YeiL [Candidatus Izimaplasma bacterium HR1]|uniref:Crp/Fnr family transcriptional regulator n=1 Tax=Candidatus Izimoplasma sp. HR1 TaxID=1541959 RepID=UPI0004F5F705|nr:DNA-binding transcriptional activator YeiL [Candidatus Izimaplasma bacterium HR1]